MTRRGRIASLAALTATAAAMRPAAGNAQEGRHPVPELRVDALIAHRTAAHGGVGVAIPTGDYLRLGLVAGVGALFDEHERSLSGRVDAVARFVFDPDARSRWGFYVAGGATTRFEKGDDPRVFLALALGAEGRRRAVGAPFVEVGYGGGLRIGLGLRREAPGQR